MITVLAESEGNLLGVEASETLTDADYTDIWIPQLDAVIEKYGKVRALIYMNEQFKGWEASALLDDAKYGLKHNNDFEKIAVVGAPGWVKWSMKLVTPFIKCEVKLFGGDQLEQAWAWLRTTETDGIADDGV